MFRSRIFQSIILSLSTQYHKLSDGESFDGYLSDRERSNTYVPSAVLSNIDYWYGDGDVVSDTYSSDRKWSEADISDTACSNVFSDTELRDRELSDN